MIDDLLLWAAIGGLLYFTLYMLWIAMYGDQP
jgi:hypothetical protein